MSDPVRVALIVALDAPNGKRLYVSGMRGGVHSPAGLEFSENRALMFMDGEGELVADAVERATDNHEPRRSCVRVQRFEVRHPPHFLTSQICPPERAEYCPKVCPDCPGRQEFPHAP